MKSQSQHSGSHLEFLDLGFPFNSHSKLLAHETIRLTYLPFFISVFVKWFQSLIRSAFWLILNIVPVASSNQTTKWRGNPIQLSIGYDRYPTFIEFLPKSVLLNLKIADRPKRKKKNLFISHLSDWFKYLEGRCVCSIRNALKATKKYVTKLINSS